MARKLTLFLIAILPLGCASTPLDTNIQGHLPLRQADQTLLTTVIQGSVGALKVAPWAEQLKDKTVSLRLIGVTGAHAERLSYSLEKHLKAEAKIKGTATKPDAEILVMVRAIGVETKRNETGSLTRGFLVGEVVLVKGANEVARIALKGHAIDSWELGASKPDRGAGKYGDRPQRRDRDRDRYDDNDRDRDRDRYRDRGRDRDRDRDQDRDRGRDGDRDRDRDRDRRRDRDRDRDRDRYDDRDRDRDRYDDNDRDRDRRRGDNRRKKRRGDADRDEEDDRNERSDRRRKRRRQPLILE